MVENERALGENLPERKKSSCMVPQRKKPCCEKFLKNLAKSKKRVPKVQCLGSKTHRHGKVTAKQSSFAGAKHRLRRCVAAAIAFNISPNAQKCPVRVFYLSAAADVQPFPFCTSRRKITQLPSVKKSTEKKTRKPSLCLAKKRGQIRRKKTRFLGRKMSQKKRVFSYLDNIES